MFRASTAQRLGARILKSSQKVQQADGSSPLPVRGETRLELSYDGLVHHFEGLVVENLDVEVLAGIPFLESNDITIRPSRTLIILSNGKKYQYGYSGTKKLHSVAGLVVSLLDFHAVDLGSNPGLNT